MILTRASILIVEDDSEISDPLAGFLREKDFTVTTAASAEAALDLLSREAVDLVLLDVMLPGQDGLELCRRLRAKGGPSIVMLTALSEPTDKVVGLELGADDYVCKPFDLRELLARVRAVLRRAGRVGSEPPAPAASAMIRFSGFSFSPQRRFARSPSGLRVPLTGAEADLLLVFCQNPRKILSRAELIRLTRGEGFAIATRSIDMLVSRLRRKLTRNDPLLELIRTVRPDGYAFQSQVAVE